MAVRKTGDWGKVALLIGNLSKEMRHASVTSLRQFGLKAEGTAKKHMSNQDLGWAALKPATLAAKLRNGQSENILIATSSYFQSITSWVDEKDMTAYAGVKKLAKNSEGDVIADIAAVHEYGSQSGIIPARPLWHPTFGETVKWFLTSNSRPDIIFLRNIKKYGV